MENLENYIMKMEKKSSNKMKWLVVIGAIVLIFILISSTGKNEIEAACKRRGHNSCADEAKEKACVGEGFDSCAEKACVGEGFDSCAEKTCKVEGYSNCAEKACIGEGFDNCAEKARAEEEECKTRGYESCAQEQIEIENAERNCNRRFAQHDADKIDCEGVYRLVQNAEYIHVTGTRGSHVVPYPGGQGAVTQEPWQYEGKYEKSGGTYVSTKNQQIKVWIDSNYGLALGTENDLSRSIFARNKFGIGMNPAQAFEKAVVNSSVKWRILGINNGGKLIKYKRDRRKDGEYLGDDFHDWNLQFGTCIKRSSSDQECAVMQLQ